jgi:hypothetical protein
VPGIFEHMLQSLIRHVALCAEALGHHCEQFLSLVVLRTVICEVGISSLLINNLRVAIA